MSYTWIDPPITPYSSKDEILAWVQVCQKALSDEPDNQAWREAMADALSLLDEADRPRSGQ